MTTQEKNQRLAEWRGLKAAFSTITQLWSIVDSEGLFYGLPHSGLTEEHAWRVCCPDYFSSLDAVHELICKLSDEQLVEYADHLICLINNVGYGYFSHLEWQDAAEMLKATAAQRAEALGITLGLWKEGE